MKIKLNISYFLAFFAMLFLLQEIHDYAHFLTANWICGCVGIKRFDNWTICDHCDVSPNILVLVTLAGPLVTLLIAWIARSMMSRKNDMETRSFGFSLLFAANPFVNILAALSGGGDITVAMHTIFENDHNRRIINIAALVVVLLFTIPPLWKAMKMLKSRKLQLLLIPLFIVVPAIVEKFVLSIGMNWLLDQGIFSEDMFRGVPLLVIMWLLVLLLVLFFTFRSLPEFISKKENKKNTHSSNHGHAN